MPGAFAHLTSVNIASGAINMDSFSLREEAYLAIMEHLEFCELGVVSPDYPYLAVTERHAKWADHMHLDMNTKAMIIAGIDAVKIIQNEDDKNKAFAWLCGFVAHIIGDVVIHPIVELKVGPYKGNEKAHRICELHQDSYIYQRLGLGEIGLAEHLDSGISKCSTENNKDKINSIVKQVWERVLETLNVEEFRSNKPEIDTWHKRFGKMITLIEEGGKLLPLARHVAVDHGLTYPAEDNIDEQYIKALQIPGSSTMDYDDIFDKAVTKIGEAWKIIGDAIFSDDEQYLAYLGDWNLDNGRDAEEKHIFWA